MTKLSARDFLTPLAIIIAGAAISGSIVWTSQHLPVPPPSSLVAAARPQQPQAPAAPVVDVADIKTDGEPFIGDKSASAVMAYFFDYQCPYCRQEELQVLPQLITDYVKTGKLRIVFKDFQFLGPDSQAAALIARAVWEASPDKFAEWHKDMFDHQDAENTGWGSKDDILALTKTIPGLDEAKVEQLLTDHGAAYQSAIDASMAEGNAIGVNGTPAFVIGKQFIAGAVPYRQFKAAVETALAGK